MFRANGPGLGPAPADVAGFTVTPVQAGVEVVVDVVPQPAGLAMSFVLPAGIDAGALEPSRRAAARPVDRVVHRAAVGRDGLARQLCRGRARGCADIRVAVTDFGFPEGTGWQRLPAWLPRRHTVWTAAATWVVPAACAAP